MSSQSESQSPLRKCKCHSPVAIVRSWTNWNPGRRFEGCKFYNPNDVSQGCNHFKWYDKVQTEWQRDLINELLLEKKLMSKEIHQLKTTTNGWELEKKRMNSELDKLKTKNIRLRDELKIFKKGDANVKCFRACCAIVCVCVCIWVCRLSS
ncbi:hypothetical protein vseg_008266 [Gypsophila vaccaria]